MKINLSRDSRGNIKKDLGWKPTAEGNYIQHRFYLGREDNQAAIRSLQLDQIWGNICQAWQRDRQTPRPQWDDVTLRIAAAVAKGEERVELPLPKELLEADLDPVQHPEFYGGWLMRHRELAPMIRLDLENRTVQDAAEPYWKTMGQTYISEGKRMLNLGVPAAPDVESSQTLHQALDAYAKHLEATQPDPTSAKILMDKVRQIKDHAEDMPLSRLDLPKIEAIINYWQKRPTMKRGKMAAVNTVKDNIKRFRHFIRWLHKSPDFAWRRPEDYEVLPVRVRETAGELADKLTAEQVETYKLEELCTLYEYATPIERTWMLLALNCDFGNKEITTLQLAEIFEKYQHPMYQHLRGRDFVRKIRKKNGVYGEWLLWPETLAGLRWYLGRRPASEETVVFLSKTGKPISTPTSGKNPDRKIFNAWIDLWNRIIRDFPEFRKLSFNKLRKTAADIVKQYSDGEVAAVFQCHGHAVKGDKLSDVYTNRPFGRVHEATEKVRAYLAPMFAVVTDPFPKNYRQSNVRLSLGQLKRIKELREQGYKIVKIAEMLGICDDTVRLHVSRL